MNIRITKGRTLKRHALDDLMRERLPQIGARQPVLDIGGKHSPYRKLVQARSHWTLDIVEPHELDVIGDAQKAEQP